VGGAGRPIEDILTHDNGKDFRYDSYRLHGIVLPLEYL
jgi:hypothetical protein